MLDNCYKLCCETFKNNLSDGFSKLQQMQEFVDVTLAADGLLVKAHQNIIAVASPYLRELLKSTPCKHPIIFLGDISQKVLCCILEYIYTGEVSIPSDVLPGFVEAAKLLHISGVKDLQIPQVNFQNKSETPSETVHFSTNNCRENIASIVLEESHDEELGENPTDDYTENFNDNSMALIHFNEVNSVPIQDEINTIQSQDNQESNSIHNDNLNEMQIEFVTLNNDWNKGTDSVDESNENQGLTPTPLYTVSNKGSLQMVMNRHVYYLHHMSYSDKKRRWRCINYRKSRCSAYVDTINEDITSRKNAHNHSFQDDQIIKLGRKKQFFTSIAEANERNSGNQATNAIANKTGVKNTNEQSNFVIKILN